MSTRRNRPKSSAAPALLVLLLLLGGSAGVVYVWKYHPEWLKAPRPPASVRTTPGKRETEEPAPAPSHHRTVAGKVHYLRLVDGEARLVAVPRTFSATAPARAAVLALLSDEAPAGCLSPLPDKVSLRGISIRDEVVTVDFSQELVSNFHGGATSEEAVVYAIVNTLTSLPGVTQVRIEVQGKPVETLGGHLDLTQPLEANNELVGR